MKMDEQKGIIKKTTLKISYPNGSQLSLLETTFLQQLSLKL